MTRPYPIVTQKSLDPSPKRGPLGLRKRFREPDEVPNPAAHEVLVFRVDGDYVQDSGRLELRDDQVVRASHVSVVDVSRDAPVLVAVSIQSGEASVFTVHVTFTCTVNDPVLVVKDGVDAATTLRSYLTSHQRLFELGLQRKVSEINAVIRDVAAQVRAYFEIKPIVVPGMTIRLAGVQVLTPQELVEFQEKRRSSEREHQIARERQEHDHRLEYDRERDGQTLEDVRRRHRETVELDQREHDRTIQTGDQRHRHDIEYGDRRHERAITAEDERHQRMLLGERRQFERDEFNQDLEIINGDVSKALLHAVVTGKLDPRELADELRAEADRHHSLEERRLSREREYELARLERDRDYERLQREEDRHNRAIARDDRLQREKAQREDERRRYDANLKLVETLAARGFLDTQNIPVEKILEDVLDTAPPAPSLPAGTTEEVQGEGDGRSAADDLREENVD